MINVNIYNKVNGDCFMTWSVVEYRFKQSWLTFVSDKTSKDAFLKQPVAIDTLITVLQVIHFSFIVL
jgi:hypothetical protein